MANYKHFTFIIPGQAIRPGIAQTASIMPEYSMQGFMLCGKYIINPVFNLSQHSYKKQYKKKYKETTEQLYSEYRTYIRAPLLI